MAEIPHVQNPVMKYGRSNGWLVHRMAFIGRRGCPDAWFFKRGTLLIVEFKAPGKKATPQQIKRHDELRAQGMRVFVIDSAEAGRKLLDEHDPDAI